MLALDSFASLTATALLEAVGTTAAPAARLIGSVALKGTLLFAAAFALTTLLRRRSAAARHAVWAAALVGQLALLLVAPVVPALELRLPALPTITMRSGTSAPSAPSAPSAAPERVVSGASPEVMTRRAGERVAEPVTPALERAASPVGAPGAPAVPMVSIADGSSGPASALPLGLIVALLWGAGALLVVARFVGGTARVAQLARAGEPVEDGAWLVLAQRVAKRMEIGRPLTLLRGSRLKVPVTWGVVYPVVLLPAESDTWTEERRRFVLVHEMAHVKRLDALTQLVAQVVVALFWFDPLVWYAAHRLRVEREHACDDYVLREGTKASAYADELLTMVRTLGRNDEAAPAFAALAMARRSEFEGRMLAILDPSADRHTLSRRGSLLMAALALVVAIPLAAIRPARADAAAPRAGDARPEEGARARVEARAVDTSVATTRALQSLATAAADAARDVAKDSATGATDSSAERSFPSIPSVASLASLPAIRTRATDAGEALSLRLPASTPVALVTPPSATAPPAGAISPQVRYSCKPGSEMRRGNHQQLTREHEDGDPTHKVSEWIDSKYERCAHAALVGAVTFTDDERQIASLGPNARASFAERRLGGPLRAVVVDRERDGQLRYSYSVDGRAAPFDAEAREWFARLLTVALRETGWNLEQRFARLRARGGVDAVLADIASLTSDGTKRRYYTMLLASRLTDAEADRILRQAGLDIDSDGDLRAVLEASLKHGHLPTAGFTAAIASIDSDGDRRAVISRALKLDERWRTSTLRTLMQHVANIDSDGDKAAVLAQAAPRFVGKEVELCDAWFAAAGSIDSDGDLRMVLGKGLAASPTELVARKVLTASRHIDSDGDKASLLVEVARRGLVTAALRPAFDQAAKTIDSDGDYRRVMRAIDKQ